MTILREIGLEQPTKTSNYKTMMVQAQCFCGNTFIAQKRSIKSGHTKSCGCLKNGSHFITTKYLKIQNERLYRTWKNIRTRCSNKNIKQSKNYSGRGISITKEWDSFKLFCEWSLSNGYKDDLSIDRINNDGNYDPSNCRWTDRKTQAENTSLLRETNTSGYRGVSKKGNKFIARATNNETNIRIYLGSYNTALKAAIAYDNYIISNNLKYPINLEKTDLLHSLEG